MLRCLSAICCAALFVLTGCSGAEPRESVAGGAGQTGSEFCKEAEHFAAKGLRNITPKPESTPVGNLARLTRLANLAPTQTLEEDLRRLVRMEKRARRSEPPTDSKVAAIKRFGDRVGHAIERRCGLQLPGV